MKESTFKKVTQPSLLLYYFRDKDHQDPVVKVSAMKRMFVQLGTPDSLKREVRHSQCRRSCACISY
jgi:hypothetical protein